MSAEDTYKVKVYKVELLIIDTDGIGEMEVKEAIENARYPNRCIDPEVKSIETREVDWSDEHPLNNFKTCEAEYKRLFSDDKAALRATGISGVSVSALVSRLNDPEQYADAVDEAIAMLKAQAAEIERLTSGAHKDTHEVQVRCTKCLTDITVMVFCRQNEIAEKVMQSVGRGVFGFHLVNSEPYCEKCAKQVEAK